jgi:poly(3-hydroxybutyrate) depolymerase
VAAAGFSAGGGVVALMACDLAGRVASVALLSGALYTEPGECRPARAVPVLAVHGTDDRVVPGGGHEAPRSIAGRSIAWVLWEFFAAHPMPG